MPAKILQADVMFLGSKRKFGEIINDDDLSRITPQTKAALISQGILEVEGMNTGGGAGLSANDSERLDRLQASSDRTNELLGKVVELLGDKKLAKTAKAAKA